MKSLFVVMFSNISDEGDACEIDAVAIRKTKQQAEDHARILAATLAEDIEGMVEEDECEGDLVIKILEEVGDGKYAPHFSYWVQEVKDVD